MMGFRGVILLLVLVAYFGKAGGRRASQLMPIFGHTTGSANTNFEIFPHSGAATYADIHEGDNLEIDITDSAENDGEFTLTCHPTVGGSHPNAIKACSKLEQVLDIDQNPFEPIPPDTMCTMQYGGPDKAHVTGSWNGRLIDAHFSRVDGCEINRWDSLQELFRTTTGPPKDVEGAGQNGLLFG